MRSPPTKSRMRSIITVESKTTDNLYNKILQRYPTILEALKPVVEIPVRT